MRKLVAAGAAVAAVLLAGGAVVVATRGDPGGDGGRDDVAATADTVVVTTTTAAPGAAAGPPSTEPGHEHGPGDDGMPHEEPSPALPSVALTCAPGFGTGPAPGPTIAAPSDQVVSLGPPGVDCHETVTGCVVGFSLRWSDGHVERASRAIDATGRYALEGDRGTVADFVVDGTQTCPTPSLTYRTTWPLP